MKLHTPATIRQANAEAETIDQAARLLIRDNKAPQMAAKAHIHKKPTGNKAKSPTAVMAVVPAYASTAAAARVLVHRSTIGFIVYPSYSAFNLA
jgi:hypothetical protein